MRTPLMHIIVFAATAVLSGRSRLGRPLRHAGARRQQQHRSRGVAAGWDCGWRASVRRPRVRPGALRSSVRP